MSIGGNGIFIFPHTAFNSVLKRWENVMFSIFIMRRSFN